MPLNPLYIIPEGTEIKALERGKPPRPYSLKPQVTKKQTVFTKDEVIVDPFLIHGKDFPGIDENVRNIWSASGHWVFELKPNSQNWGSIFVNKRFVKFEHSTTD